MSTKRLFSALLVACVATVNLAAQSASPWVTINGYEAHPTRIIAKFKKDTSSQGKSSTLSKTGLQIVYNSKLVSGLVSLDEAGATSTGKSASTGATAQTLAARIQELTDSGLFEYVQPNYVKRHTATPTDDFFVQGQLWGLQNFGGSGGVAGVDIEAPRAWNISTGSPEVIVGVIDTGVLYNHQDLVSRMWTNPGETGTDVDGNAKESNGVDDDNDGYVDNVYGINAYSDSGDPIDLEGHGTHVAGTIGAEANGAGPHVGVAWNVRIMALKFLGPQGGFTDDAIECLDFAVSKGVKLSNNSWGGGPFEQALFDSIAAARAAGHLFIAAAGNDASNNDAIDSYPDGYELDNVISVAAIDRANQLADFSNYGRTKVDLGAPGVDILSTWSSGQNAYNTISGTSMASPHVTGVAALLMSAFPTAGYLELRERLLTTVDPVPALNGRTVTGGRVNAYRALALTVDTLMEVRINPPSGSYMVRGTNHTVSARVTDTVTVTDATVTAITDNSTGLITFANDGVAPDAQASDSVYTSDIATPSTGDSLTLTFSIDAPTKLPLTKAVTYTLIDLPSNDNFENAIKLASTGARVTTVNTFATIQLTEPNHGGVLSKSHSLWWTWTAPASGPALVDTSGSTFDTVLAVYRGNQLNGLTSVASANDVDGKAQGYVFFNAVAGVTYRIAVASTAENESGTLRLSVIPSGQLDNQPPVVTITSPANGRVFTSRTLTITGTAIDGQPGASGVKEVLVKIGASPIPLVADGTTTWSSPAILQPGPNTIEVTAVDYAGLVSAKRTISISYLKLGPPNDVFVNALPLEGGLVTGNNEEGTKEKGEPAHAQNQGGKSVWWTYSATQDGVLTLDTEGSDFDTVLATYTGQSVTNLTTIGYNDDALAGSGYSKLAFAVRSGQAYHIAVDGFAGTSGNITLAYAFAATNLFDVTVTVNGEGTVTPDGGSFEAGSTVVLSAQPARYNQFLGWEGDVISSDNPLSIVLTADTAVTAVFAPRVATDDFETGDFSKVAWVNGLNSAAWVIRTDSVARGEFSASSGAIPNNGRSVLSLTANLRAGLASFDYRVSSEEGWDFLEFYVNGVRQDRWSGQTSWTSYAFETTAGTNTLEWHYVKDSSNQVGADAGFIDNVDLPISFGLGAALSIKPSSTAGGVGIQMKGESGQTYIIQVSSDLVNWTSISTNTAVNGVIYFVDQEVGNDSARFYRAVLP